MNVSLLAIAAVVLVTLGIGVFGLRVSRTTDDFYVASRRVAPWLNASAIGGEYLSAASFMGVAALLFSQGLEMMWVPIGYTAGFLVLLVLIASPLRRSGAYTVPDFAALRLGSRSLRKLCSVLVVVVGWIYLWPQFHGASLILASVSQIPEKFGGIAVAVVVVVSVAAGGMRSITIIQAFQYWFKLCAIAVPTVILLIVWQVHQGTLDIDRFQPAFEATDIFLSQPSSFYTAFSLLLGLALGTMGLPHIVVRFYTNTDGRAARKTTASVIALISLFYLFPIVLAVIGRNVAGGLTEGGHNDSWVFQLPQVLLPGGVGTILTALIAAGGFAALLSTSSGLITSVSGVLNQEFFRGGVRGFRVSAVLAVIVPLLAYLVLDPLPIADSVTLAFTVTSLTFSPMLILGIWWSKLTDAGAIIGMSLGAVISAVCAVVTLGRISLPDWLAPLIQQPAAWAIPVVTATMVLASLATATRIPANTQRILELLHTPDQATR